MLRSFLRTLRSGAVSRRVCAPLAGLAVILGGCAVAGAPGLAPTAHATSAAEDPYGDWVGMLVREKGSNCPTAEESLMQIMPKHILFAPQTGTLVLRGVPDKQRQHYHAQLVLQDNKDHPVVLVFEAHPVGDTFEGVYGAADCRAHITLKRPGK
ncbi:hypothetical protein OQ496_11530 [Acetobacter suratthaniensis]|uniref:hypothetical protein n=1 Tax=Acetobacter suratthaniensis TaxID=1502841 RepID=UPI001FAFDDCE|nr:hypothetical protein [Acetobacter suratthaniensis]MCX2567082.1 hypothetical protein [Acetobacter suratthaniensis]